MSEAIQGSAERVIIAVLSMKLPIAMVAVILSIAPWTVSSGFTYFNFFLFSRFDLDRSESLGDISPKGIRASGIQQ